MNDRISRHSGLSLITDVIIHLSANAFGSVQNIYLKTLQIFVQMITEDFIHVNVVNEIDSSYVLIVGGYCEVICNDTTSLDSCSVLCIDT